ncbi:hypothetical protein EXIGLDRAFT_764635 [Exidia glandulosa HHB12029]|uniref:Uncharacterized protein n=1 Tax=Exidia glandulosa HHB12029 TaxID=1314781 RepID=A0A165L0V1_EXIGL|nr:hypothetical protein EXIGLDRAFT_764635 [Exidia glandulosa HHB12029]
MDRFRPNLPLDPFEQMEPHFGRAAWLLDPDVLDDFAASSATQRDVLLVVGEPTPESLRPLLTSTHLAHSLVIVATSNAFDAQTLCPVEWTRPSVRILRLDSPLQVQDGGGARFIHVLEWAERVARVWRANPDSKQRVIERFEADDDLVPGRAANGGGQGHALSQKTSDASLRSAWLTPPSLHGHGSPSSSPRTSVVMMESPNASASSLPVPSSFRAPKGQRRPSNLPHADPSKRPFDALLNFMPPQSILSPKGLLKQAIMVTTLSRPFLTVPVTTPRPPPSQRHSQAGTLPGPRQRSGSTPDIQHRRSSTLNPDRSPPSTSSTPGATTPIRPRSGYFPPSSSRASHILHILPDFADDDGAHGHAALVRALEAFILNFSDAGLAEREERARPFILDDASLGEPVQREGWGVLDAVLAGALDRGTGTSGRALDRRAWLAGAADIELRVPGEPAPPSAAMRSRSSGKGKQRAVETALPSPPPSPPQVPAMMVTPPSAVDGSIQQQQQFHHHSSPSPLTLTPESEKDVAGTASDEKAGMKRRKSHDSNGSSQAGNGCLGMSSRGATKSETAVAQRKRRWWWPFSSSKNAPPVSVS